MRAAPLTAALLVGSIAFAPRVAHAEAADNGNSVRTNPPSYQRSPQTPLAPANHPQIQSKKPIYDDFEGLDALTPVSRPKIPSQATSAPAVTPSNPVTAALQEAVASPSTTETVFRQRRPTPTDRLAAQIRRGRLFLYNQACTAEDAINSGMSRAFDLEHSFTSTVASLAPGRETNEKLMPGLIYVLVAGMAGSIVSRNRNILLRTSVPLALGIGAAGRGQRGPSLPSPRPPPPRSRNPP